MYVGGSSSIPMTFLKSELNEFVYVRTLLKYNI